ncbi:MAG: CapA family protein [Bacteroidaceae bacterium]|nr:CapA family protein [Bacteroidaceae bacterium]
MKLTCIALVVSVLLVSCSQQETREQDSLTLVFTGDVLLDRGVRPYAEREGIPALFAGVDSVFRQADAVIINLECPLTDTATPINKHFVFRGEPQWAKGLRAAGITHAAMANNHTYDQGRQGLLSTYNHLKEAGIEPLGYGNSKSERLEPVIIRKGAIEVALFNSVTLPLENWYDLDDRPGICQASASTLADAIRTFHAHHPTTKIIAVLHWGAEMQTSPTMQQRIDAQILLQAGADAIVGHHPHVVQPLINIYDKSVFYSLGNFVFDQSLSIAQQAAMAQITFMNDSIIAKSLPVRIVRNKPQLNL